MHVHIIAVSGTGMGALAGLLVELGHEVSGSDVAFDPPMGPLLRAWGVRTCEGFGPEHLEPAPDLVVVGNVCRANNPEVVAALERGLPYTHIAGALERFLFDGCSPLVVAGTHGKTTTTALSAWILDQAGQHPGFLVGGIPKNFGKSFRRPGSRSLPLAESEGFAMRGLAAKRAPFVVEGDEYDTAFFEKTAKFLHYRPEVAILTSIEHDHVDIYPSFDAYREAFARFVALLPPEGLLIANAADPSVVELALRHARAKVRFYALEGEPTHGVAPHYVAARAGEDRSGTAFDLFAGGMALGRTAVSLHGDHNLKNTLGAVAAALEGYGARLAAIQQALPRFSGVKRRQELLGRPAGVAVYDDFAHHPTSVAETLKALRAMEPGQRLLAVFEPRTATACRKVHQAAYAEAFARADAVFLAPLGRSGLGQEETLDLSKLVTDLHERGQSARALESVPALVEALVSEAQAGDAILLLSNGAFGGIHQKLIAALGERRDAIPRSSEDTT